MFASLRCTISPRLPLFLRALSTESSVEASQKCPDLFHGVLTDYGWVLVRKTHIARGWTQPQINSFLQAKLSGPTQTWTEVQAAVDEWARAVDLKEKPKQRKPSAKDKRIESDLKLFMQQQRDATLVDETGSETTTKSRAKFDGEVTFTNAWNYFVTIRYKDFSHLAKTDARREVGKIWRSMSMSEKDVYREEYSRLLRSGKDILHGKVVDREIKLKSTEKLRAAKKKSQLRKVKKMQNLDVEAEQPAA